MTINKDSTGYQIMQFLGLVFFFVVFITIFDWLHNIVGYWQGWVIIIIGAIITTLLARLIIKKT
jgi:hypothetical protein